MNTSMLIERFHRKLKHEVLGTKGNVRVDALLDALLTLVPDMQEEREIKMSRGLWEGRHRLQEQHKAHAIAIKMYFCDCQSDAKSGVSCVNIHAASLYAPEEKLAAFEEYCDPRPIRNEDWPEHQLDENANLTDEISGIGSEMETLQNMLQELDLITAAMRPHILQLKRVADSDVNAVVARTVELCRDQERVLHSLCVKKNTSSSQSSLQKRAELLAIGRLPNPPPIRLSRRKKK
ncbi:hypothetical protein GCK32_016846 [Trichostrongylus colubriformis]|uniref:Uncharacterized protein n=1 Tax=Trichostrongylus colubriformis TaxID=6319 RepID=A0AAN8F2B9_TRICO